MRALLASVVLLGCSIPDKHLVSGDAKSDSPRAIDGNGGADAGGPFACFGKPLPTTAPPQLMLMAHTVDASNATAVANVNLSGYLVSNPATPLYSVTTDANGNVSATVPTNMQPIDGFLVATAAGTSGYLTSNLYPSRPFDEDRSFPVNLLTQTSMSQLATVGNVSYDTTKAQMSIVVVDCNGVPLANATVAALDASMTPTGVIRYLSGGLPSMGAMATDASGLAFVFNVNPGSINVTAVVGGMTLRAHRVNASAGQWTQAAIQP